MREEGVGLVKHLTELHDHAVAMQVPFTALCWKFNVVIHINVRYFSFFCSYYDCQDCHHLSVPIYDITPT